MNLKAAKCPSCSAELQLPENKDFVICMYCDNRIVVREAIEKKSNDIGPLIELMETAFAAGGDGNELIQYCNKVLEVDSKNSLALLYKGLGNAWQARYNEAFVNIQKAVEINQQKAFIEKAHNLVLLWCDHAFDFWYYNWSASPGTDLHCDNKYKRMTYESYWLQQLDSNYINNINGVNSIVDLANHILPSSSRGHELVINKLKIVKNIDFSERIQFHNKKLQELGKNTIEVQSKSGCFIATATMGNYNHPLVVELREFRDDYILQKPWGKSFVNWYYKYGSMAAKIIGKSSVLKKMSYIVVIKPIVCLSRIIRSK